MKRLLRYLRKVIPHNSPIRLWYTRSLQIYAHITKPTDTSDIKLIGVTGTDGKTTTVEMIAHILQEQRVKYLSSSSYESKLSGKSLAMSKRTTPSLSTLKELIKQAKAEQTEVIVIEVSSHSLAQWRLFGIKFDTAVLTNITHEHLNFHKTKANYAKAKKLLFTKHLKKSGKAILNKSDQYGAKWLKELGKQAVAYIPPISSVSISGTTFNYNDSEYSLPMLGAYNATNALAAALAVAETLKSISVGGALSSLKNFSGVPGRMQMITNPDVPFAVFVDFALTRKAMASTLSTLREVAGQHKIFVVFGATGGQHDTTVRPGLAESVSSWADVAIVTDDEPYDGDPAEIREELEQLIKTTNKKNNRNTQVLNIADRREAIHTALSKVQDGDIVLVSGMGHYTSRTVNGNEVPWNDATVITEELQKL